MVPGDPQPKGSFHVQRRGTKVWAVPGSNANMKNRMDAWAHVIKTYAAATMRANGLSGTVDGPLAADLTFYLARPKSAPKRLHCAVKPDLDKLVRAAIDPLVGLAISEDSRIVSLSARKVYADDENPPGAFIHVWSV